MSLIKGAPPPQPRPGSPYKFVQPKPYKIPKKFYYYAALYVGLPFLVGGSLLRYPRVMEDFPKLAITGVFSETQRGPQDYGFRLKCDASLEEQQEWSPLDKYPLTEGVTYEKGPYEGL